MKKLRLFLRKYDHIFFLLLFLFAVLICLFREFLLHPVKTVVINEVCTSNLSCYEDDLGDYPDWVELYNPTDKSVDISGYILSRSVTPDKDMTLIPAGTVLLPGEFYLVESAS